MSLFSFVPLENFKYFHFFKSKKKTNSWEKRTRDHSFSNISYLLICYQGVHVSLSENFANVLNEWFPKIIAWIGSNLF